MTNATESSCLLCEWDQHVSVEVSRSEEVKEHTTVAITKDMLLSIKLFFLRADT